MLTNLQIAAILFTMLLTVALPLGLMVWFQRKGGRWTEFLAGAAIFILFALVLEQLLHTLVLASPLAEALKGSIWLYGLYGGLAAGLFEETGRLFAFRLLLKNRKQPAAALAYGAGHGGAEAILLVGMAMVNNLAVAAMAASGNLTDPALQEAAALLEATAPGMYLWSALERTAAIGLHIALSVLVFAAVRNRKPGLYLLSILLHAAVDFLAVVLNSFFPISVTELAVVLLTVLAVLISRRVWRTLPQGEGKNFPETP